jgi:hypothetical protein
MTLSCVHREYQRCANGEDTDQTTSLRPWTGILDRVDHFLAGEEILIKLINSGLLFAAWHLVSSYKLEQAQGVLVAHLSRNPALFVKESKAGIPPSCDYMRSALTLAETYASALPQVEYRCREQADMLEETKDVLETGLEKCDDLDFMLRDWECGKCKKRVKTGPALSKVESVRAKMRRLVQRSLP